MMLGRKQLVSAARAPERLAQVVLRAYPDPLPVQRGVIAMIKPSGNSCFPAMKSPLIPVIQGVRSSIKLTLTGLINPVTT